MTPGFDVNLNLPALPEQAYIEELVKRLTAAVADRRVTLQIYVHGN